MLTSFQIRKHVTLLCLDVCLCMNTLKGHGARQCLYASKLKCLCNIYTKLIMQSAKLNKCVRPADRDRDRESAREVEKEGETAKNERTAQTERAGEREGERDGGRWREMDSASVYYVT